MDFLGMLSTYGILKLTAQSIVSLKETVSNISDEN